MKNTVFVPCLLIIAMLSSGCAGSGPEGSYLGFAHDRVQTAPSTPDAVNMRIAEASERAAKALEAMSLVEQARTPVDMTPPPLRDAPEELKQLVTITWVGPIETVSALMADVAGYEFDVIGERPQNPVIVNVEVTQRPVMEVLRSLGLQAGRTADLSVNADKRVIEVRYAPVPAL